MRPRARVVIAAVAMTISTVAGGCTSGGEEAEVQPVSTTTATTTTAPTTTTTRATTTTTSKWSPDQQAAIDAYMAFYDTYIDVKTSDRPTSDLSSFTVGDFGTRLRILISEDRRNGLAGRRPENSVTRAEAKSAARQDDRWVVETCEANDLVRYKVADGTVLDDSVVTRHYRIQIVSNDGALKVADQEVLTKSSGDQVATCLNEP